MGQPYTRRHLLGAVGTAVGVTVVGTAAGDTVVGDASARSRPTCEVETVVSTASSETATATSGSDATGTATPTETVVDACDAAVDTNATVDGEPTLHVPPAEVTVTGESTCDAGTELGICVESTGGGLFVMSDFATVDEDGTWSVELDFEGIDVGATFALTVVLEGRALARLPECEVVAADGSPGGTATTEPPVGTEDDPPPTSSVPPTSFPPERTETPPGGRRDPPPTATSGGWSSLFRPLLAFLGIASAGLLAVGALLARWRIGGDAGEG